MIPESPIFYVKVRRVVRKSIVIFSLFVVLLLAACGESGSMNEASVEANEETEANSKEVLAEEDFDKMYSNPKEYKGYEVEFTGQVFVDPERDDSSVYLQVYAKPEQFEQNTIVAYEDSNFDVKVDDFVKVIGIVKDEFEGENLMGGTITAPFIEATSIEVVDYITAVAPTIKEVVVDETIDQHGMEVTLQKIEFAESKRECI